MFVEIRNDRSGLRLLLNLDSIESFQFEVTNDEQTSAMIFRIWLHLKSGNKSYLLDQATDENKAECIWQNIVQFANSDTKSDLVFSIFSHDVLLTLFIMRLQVFAFHIFIAVARYNKGREPYTPWQLFHLH